MERVLTEAEIKALGRLGELLDLAKVNVRQRWELRTFPLVAVEVLEYALARRKIRNPAAYAVDRFRARTAAAHPVTELGLVQEREVLPLEEFELALAAARRLGAPAPVIEQMALELEERRSGGD